MRGKKISRGAAFLLVLCALVVVLSACLIVAKIFLPAPSPPASAKTQPLFILPESPEPPPSPVKTMTATLAAAVAPAITEHSEPLDIPEVPPPQPEDTPYLALVSPPARMRIPALSLDYEIRGTDPDEAGNMQIVPALPVISWFKASPIPGNKGNAILGGHNTWNGEYSRLFTLDKLEIGDEMDIEYTDGTSIKFLLESVFVYALKTAPADQIMDVGGDARVTLITCKGPFNTETGTSDNRIVATFKEERLFVFPDPPIEPFPPKISD